MTRRKMYMRMITASLVRRRSRMLVALLAIAVGATILSGLVTIYYDVPRQMGAQFRSYGANMIFLASSNDAVLDADTTQRGLDSVRSSTLVGATPYRYETVRIHEQPIVAAGTDFESAKKTSPYWSINGQWPEKDGQMLVGQSVADSLALKVGDKVNVLGEEDEDADLLSLGLDLEVTGILDTGGSEEDYVYISLTDLVTLCGEGEYDVVEVSLSGTQESLQSDVSYIASAVPEIAPRLVKRVTQSETTVLGKLQALVFLVTVVVLVLTMICVATTMTAVVTERRKEIGLRKALGASDQEIIREFMGEGILLGGLGGILGSALGFGFAQLVSVHVFASSITYQPLLLPVTLIVSVAVTALACLLPVRSATDVDPALVLKGE